MKSYCHGLPKKTNKCEKTGFQTQWASTIACKTLCKTQFAFRWSDCVLNQENLPRASRNGQSNNDEMCWPKSLFFLLLQLGCPFQCSTLAQSTLSFSQLKYFCALSNHFQTLTCSKWQAAYFFAIFVCNVRWDYKYLPFSHHSHSG